VRDLAADVRALRLRPAAAERERERAAADEPTAQVCSAKQRVVHESAAVVAHQVSRSAPSNLMHEAVLLQYAVDTQLDSALKVGVVWGLHHRDCDVSGRGSGAFRVRTWSQPPV
jgi:hypothetical protein